MNDQSEESQWADLVARLSEDPRFDDIEREYQGGLFARFDPLGIAKVHDDGDPLAQGDPWDSAPPEMAPAGIHIRGDQPLGAGPRDYSVSEDEEFVPAEPAHLHSFEPALVIAWLGVVAGPFGMVVASMFFSPIPLAVVIVLVLFFLTGVGYLIYRLPEHRDHNDDGASI